MPPLFLVLPTALIHKNWLVFAMLQQFLTQSLKPQFYGTHQEYETPLDFQTFLRPTDKRTDVWSQDFMIWKINFGLRPELECGKKRVWADYEQLLRPGFSLFRGQKFSFLFFWKHHSVRTKKLHRKNVKKIYFFGGKNFFFQKNQFFLGLKIRL